MTPKRSRGGHSIRARLTLTFSVVTAVLLVVVWAVLMWSLRYGAERAADVLVRDSVTEISGEVAEATQSELKSVIVEESTTWGAEGIAVRIVNSAGALVASSGPKGPAWPRPPGGDGWRTETRQAGNWRVVVGVPWGTTEQVLRAQAFLLAVFCLLVESLATVGAWWLVGRTLAPIDALARQAARQSAGENLHTRLVAPSEDAEVRNLIATLNALLDQISRVATTRGAFYAAASHELRTPLHVLCGQAELALSRPRSVDEYRLHLVEIQEQAMRLDALIRSLLTLHRLETRSGTVPAEPADLVSLCEVTLAALAPTIRERHLNLTVQAPTELVIQAPPPHLEMLVRNLVDNAIRYATNGGAVGIEIVGIVSGATLRVSNDATLLPGTDLNRFQEAFYRPDASRTSDTGGNGLGLAICKAIADGNGWDISMEWSSGRVCVTVTFRNSQPPDTRLLDPL